MKGSKVTQTIRTRLKYGVLLALASAIVVLVVLGCGGGGGSTKLAPSTLWVQQDASYVGAISCRDCHANIHDQYTEEQPMGMMTGTLPSTDPKYSMPDARHTQAANCNGCHVTGYGEPTGGKLDGTTPHLDGIGCEACHGPGSQHINADSKVDRKKTITRVPPDQTCWNCHGGRLSTANGYRQGALNQPFTPVTADTYKATLPKDIRGPHYAPAAFLLGWNGYEHTEPMPSPHASLPNTCLDCHQKTISDVTGKVDHGEHAQAPNTDTSRAECSSCHTGRSSGEHLVQKAINEMLIELIGEDSANPGNYDPNQAGGLLAAYVTAHSIALSTNTTPDDPYVITYKAARSNIRYVISDHSMGVHNPAFAKRILEEAKEMLEEND